MRNICLAIGLSFFAVNVSLAGDTLSGDEIKQLVSGNTAYMEHAKKHFEVTRYFAAGGKLTQYRSDNFADGTYLEGEWSVDGNKLCMQMGRGKGGCGTLAKNEDRYDYAVKHGKIVWLFKKVAAGNPEKM